MLQLIGCYQHILQGDKKKRVPVWDDPISEGEKMVGCLHGGGDIPVYQGLIGGLVEGPFYGCTKHIDGVRVPVLEFENEGSGCEVCGSYPTPKLLQVIIEGTGSDGGCKCRYGYSQSAAATGSANGIFRIYQQSAITGPFIPDPPFDCQPQYCNYLGNFYNPSGWYAITSYYNPADPYCNNTPWCTEEYRTSGPNSLPWLRIAVSISSYLPDQSYSRIVVALSVSSSPGGAPLTLGGRESDLWIPDEIGRCMPNAVIADSGTEPDWVFDFDSHRATVCSLVGSSAIVPNWVSGLCFSVGNALLHNSGLYACKVDHRAASASEPGVGASWTTYWTAI